MALLSTPINGINRNNTFIKSATDDLQDPLFLTFRLDFFPEREQYPIGDGLYNSSLLKQPGIFNSEIGEGATVEYSTQDWLQQYYGADYQSDNIKVGHPNPYLALYKFREGLRVLQDMPWYFQSIGGIGDLWRSAQVGITDGSKKITGLTINCLESVMQPLTDLVENYRYAIYDQDRLAFRVPENLRWFDLVIDLVEIREIVDHSDNIFRKDPDGNILQGLKVIQFRCKMCEFDFSDFLNPVGALDYYAYNTDKPFYPSFKIKVGWVNQEVVNLQDAADLKTIGLFSALSNIVGNRINKFVQGAGRLPGQLIGSVLSPLTSALEGAVFGNAYEGLASDIKNIPTIMSKIQGVKPTADIPIPYSTDILAGTSDTYADSIENYPQVKSGPPNRFDPNPPGTIDINGSKKQVDGTINIYDTEILKGTADAYPESDRDPVVGPPTGKVYPNQTESVAEPTGNAYPNQTESVGRPPTGNVYPNQPESVGGPPTGDVYPNQTESVGRPPTGKVYPNRPESVGRPPTGDVYPNQTESVTEPTGNVYSNQTESIAEPTGDVYPNQTESVTEPTGNVYST